MIREYLNNAAWKGELPSNPALNMEADSQVAVQIMVVLFIVRFCLAGAYHPILRHFPCLFGMFSSSLKNYKLRTKFNENLWYSCWHTFSTIMTFRALSMQPWAQQLLDGQYNEVFFTNFSNHPCPPEVKQWYLVEIGFWSSTFLFLMLETIRKDFTMMFVHHFATIFLLGTAYSLNFTRIGLVVQILHDVGDIVLYVAKSCQYWQSQYTGKFFTTDVLFGCFALTFYITRCMVFPRVIVWPVIRASLIDVIDDPIIKKLGGMTPFHFAFPGFLSALQCLHLMWGFMIGKMIYRQINSKTVAEQGDIRSDDEDDEKKTQ